MNKPIIVCVDDEKIILDSLKDQLKSAFKDKYNIEIAESGVEAIELIKDLKSKNIEVPIVISDHIMPHMKGDILLIIVNTLLPEAKKILLTGQTTREEIINAINNADLYRFISKPWDEQDLYLTVEKGLQSFYKYKNLEDQNAQLKLLVSELQKINRDLRATTKTNELEDRMFDELSEK